MIRPTVEKIDEIIDKLKELQTTIATIEDRPLEFPKHKENNDKSVSVEQGMRLVAGQGLSEKYNELEKTLTQPEEILEWLFLSKNALTVRIIAKLPTLPMDTLKKLRTDDIPKLLRIDSVAKVKEQVWQGESPFTEEAQNLHFIQKEIDKQIQKNIEAAKERRRNEHIQPLRDEIEILLSPYDDFLQKYITLDVKDLLSSGNTSPLGKVIHEFEKIRYRVKTETEQAVTGKGNKTGEKPKAETWEQITIEIVDDDTIKYKTNGKNWVRANYTELGFLDKRKHLPNKLWLKFLSLAVQNKPVPNHPEITNKNMDNIRTTLRKFFGLQEIPIKYDYKNKKYCCMFRFYDNRSW